MIKAREDRKAKNRQGNHSTPLDETRLRASEGPRFRGSGLKTVIGPSS